MAAQNRYFRCIGAHKCLFTPKEDPIGVDIVITRKQNSALVITVPLICHSHTTIPSIEV